MTENEMKELQELRDKLAAYEASGFFVQVAQLRLDLADALERNYRLTSANIRAGRALVAAREFLDATSHIDGEDALEELVAFRAAIAAYDGNPTDAVQPCERCNGDGGVMSAGQRRICPDCHGLGFRNE